MIRFPKMHIAQSVVNRILNAADDINAQPRSVRPAPTVPDPTKAGAQLDAALATPPAAVSPPAGAEQDMLGAAIVGSSPVDAAVERGLEEGL